VDVINSGDCVKIPDGRIARVRDNNVQSMHVEKRPSISYPELLDRSKQ
jgi:hypothetical protein